MKKSILFLFLFSIMAVSAQDKMVYKIPSTDSVFEPKLTGDFFYESKLFIGDMYFNKDWESGDVLLNNGEYIQNKKLKYNGFEDELIWLNDLHFQKIKIDKASIREFKFNDKNLVFRKINENEVFRDSTKQIFVQVAVDDSVSLFIQRKVSLHWPRYLVVNNVRRKYDVLIHTPVYIIRTVDKKIHVLEKLSRRNVLSIFKEHPETVRSIIRSRELNLKKESDLIQLIHLLNAKGD